jgi:hypothetical protein
MLDDSIKDIEWVKQTLEQQMEENKREIQQKIAEFDKNKQRNDKIINNSRASPVEQLRALVSNAIESDTILQLHRLQQSLIINMVLTNSVRIFQNEVIIELGFLRSKDTSQASKIEEPKKYAEIETEIQRIKQTIEEEYRPLMDSLKEEMENRKKYLDEHR